MEGNVVIVQATTEQTNPDCKYYTRSDSQTSPPYNLNEYQVHDVTKMIDRVERNLWDSDAACINTAMHGRTNVAYVPIFIHDQL